ncbi:MAG: hypothetical protein ACYS29_06835, partial [Planctomycetota bacterium]
MNTKVTTIIATIGLCLGIVSPASALVTTFGGSFTGTKVEQTFKLHQDAYFEGASDLHFKVSQKEDWVYINGWSITITDFTAAESEADGVHAVEVDASNPVTGTVPYCTNVEIRVTLWLTGYNTIRMSDQQWTKGVEWTKAAPDFGWTVGYPYAHLTLPDIYLHTLTFYNDDTSSIIYLNEVKTLTSSTDYNADQLFSSLSFTGLNQITAPPLTINPGGSQSVTIQTNGKGINSHIYATFKFADSSTATADLVDGILDHPVISATTTGPVINFDGTVYESSGATIYTGGEFGICDPVGPQWYQFTVPGGQDLDITCEVPIIALSFLEICASLEEPFDPDTNDIILTDVWSYNLDPGLEPDLVPPLTGFDPYQPQISPNGEGW